MITRDEFQTMQTAARCLIETVFNYEDEFKKEFITGFCHYPEDDYSIQRAHISGYSIRVELEFSDGDTVDIYRDLTDVMEWYYAIAGKVTGKGE